MENITVEKRKVGRPKKIYGVNAPPKSSRKVGRPKKITGFVCDFCKHEFVNEQSLFIHMCEKKRRTLDKDAKYVQSGFSIFQKFYDANNLNFKKQKTFDQFINSKYYVNFTKFARYLQELNPVNPNEFINFLIRAGVKIAKWEAPSVYEIYLIELNKLETPDAAIERTVRFMEKWANENGEPLTDFFIKVNPILATSWIQSGRISPWLLFVSKSGNNLLLNRLSEEQKSIVEKTVDSNFWDQKIKSIGMDINNIKDTFDLMGL